MHKEAGKTSIFITIPSLCKLVEVNVIFNERISELIAKVLSKFKIKDEENFHLMGRTPNIKMFEANDSCNSLFASNFDSFILDNHYVVPITVYFEGQEEIFFYDVTLNLDNLISMITDRFVLPIHKNYFIIIDPSTNNILPIDKPTVSPALVVFRIETHANPLIFDLSHFPSQKDHSSFYLSNLSRLILTDSMKSLFAQVRSHINDEDFQIITLTNDEITKCLHVFTTGQNVLSLTPVQQNSLLFILLSFQSKSLAPTLSSLCSSSMSLPNDLLRLNSIISILFSFPLPLYLMLLELSRTFGGIPAHPLRRKKVIELITEVIFREHQNIEFERNFISFILTFYRIIFRDTFLTDDTEFRTDSETLYITNSDKILYTFKGKSTTNYSDTNPFNPESIDIVTNLHTQFGKSTDNNKNIITNEIINNNFNLLNERIDKIHKLVNKYKLRNQLTFINNSIPSPQAFFQLDYDNYALSELPEQIMTEVSPIILEDNDDEFKVRSLDTALLEPKVSRPISNNKHLIPKPRVKINQTPIQSNNIFERSKTSDMFNSLRTTSSYVKLNNINNNIRNLRNRMNAKRDSLEAWSSELEFFSSENSNSLEMFNTMKSDVSGLNSLKLEEEDYDEEDEEELDEEDENVEKK